MGVEARLLAPVRPSAPDGAAAAWVPVGPADPVQWVRVGERYYITGCPGDRFLFPRVSLWDRPPGASAAAEIGLLAGTSESRLCQGTVVLVRELAREMGRRFVRVETIDEGLGGWVGRPFIGLFFPRDRCRKHFANPLVVERCLDPPPDPAPNEPRGGASAGVPHGPARGSGRAVPGGGGPEPAHPPGVVRPGRTTPSRPAVAARRPRPGAGSAHTRDAPP